MSLPYGVRYLPSASELDRAIGCPSSFAIPRIDAEPGEAALAGRTVHEFIRKVLDGADPELVLESLDRDTPGRDLCEALDVAQLPRGGDQEVAVAWDPATCGSKLLGKNIDREYEQHGADRSMEITGSADFVGQRDAETLVVLDYKSGRRTAAEQSWQLRWLAMVFAELYGARKVVAGLGFLRGSRIFWDWVELDALSFAATRAAMRRMVNAIMTATKAEQPMLREGSYCFFCPAWKRCAAKVGLIREMGNGIAIEGQTLTGLVELPAGQRLNEEGLREVNDAVVASLFLKVERWEAALKRVRAEAEAYAARRPIDLGDGRTLRLASGDYRDQVTSGPEAIRELSEVTDEECAGAAVRTTKGAIEEAVAGYAKRVGTPIGKTKKAAIEHLRGRGLILKVPGEEKVRIVKQAEPKPLPAESTHSVGE